MVATSSKMIAVADASSSKYCRLHGESRSGTRGPTERRGGGVSARVVAGGLDRPSRPGRRLADRPEHVAERVYRADALVRDARTKPEDERPGLRLRALAQRHVADREPPGGPGAGGARAILLRRPWPERRSHRRWPRPAPSRLAHSSGERAAAHDGPPQRARPAGRHRRLAALRLRHPVCRPAAGGWT